MRVFSCEGCAYYRADGWPGFKAAGGVIMDGPCRQYRYYNHEGAKLCCRGELYRSQIEERSDDGDQQGTGEA
jgi:hypothetical protein